MTQSQFKSGAAFARGAASFAAASPASEQIYGALARLDRFIVIAAGVDFIVTFFNAAAEKALGYSAEEIVGRRTPALWFGVDAGCDFETLALQAVRPASGEKDPAADIKGCFVRRDGSRLNVLLAIEAMREADGDVGGFLLIASDMSELDGALAERDRSIEKLARTNAEFENFAHVAAHDMQEPLRAISSFGDIVVSDYEHLLDDEGRGYLRMIRDAAQRMQTMVVDLLDYTRLGREPASQDLFDAQEIYRHALENLAPAIAAKEAKIGASGLPSLHGSAAQFLRLLQNLIGNAVKYSRADAAPVIRIGAEDEKDAWHFTVADNGIGIDDGGLTKIFEPFKRLHNRQCYAGTGLGLSACKRIVENHGGKIWCVSAPRQGSVFHFTWPK